MSSDHGEKQQSEASATCVASPPLNDLLPCPFCGGKADLWWEFDIARAGCSDESCPASFGDEGVSVVVWQKQKNVVAEYLLECLKSHHMTREGISTLVRNAERMLAG